VALGAGLGVAVAGVVVGAVAPVLDAGGAVAACPEVRPADPTLGTVVAGRDVEDGAGVALGDMAVGCESTIAAADADAAPASLVSLSSDD
jgi:hypothetical protein